MRVNVYAEEILLEVVQQEEKINDTTGRAYSAVRFMLHSSDRLHHTATDDDRSAVTFWGRRELLRELFNRALMELK